MENVKYLGSSSFTSKKGSPCFMLHLARPFDTRFGVGFKAEAMYVTENDYNMVKDCKPFTDCVADIRYINGRDALISIARA